MTDVFKTESYTGPGIRINEKLEISAHGAYADYSFDSGAKLTERGGTASMSYTYSLYWGAGANISSRHLNSGSFGGLSSFYIWKRIADPAVVSLTWRRERLLNNRANILSGRAASTLKTRGEIFLSENFSVGANISRGRVDGGNYFTIAGTDAKASFSEPLSLFWAKGSWERTSYARGSALYFAPRIYNTYSLEAAWRRYFAKRGVYYGAPHFYAEVKMREIFDNSRYFNFNPRAGIYAEREKYWTLKLEFSLTSSHYYRDNYWEFALVKVF